jgi:hypothetical protein
VYIFIAYGVLLDTGFGCASAREISRNLSFLSPRAQKKIFKYLNGLLPEFVEKKFVGQGSLMYKRKEWAI